jgi:transcription antitermination factor NusG
MYQWYCIYTKPSYEDHLSRKLTGIDSIEILNPKLRRKKYIRGRLKEAIEQFFPCYIFARFDIFDHYHIIRYTRGVRRIVGDAMDSPHAVDECIIDILKSKIIEGFIKLEPPVLRKGEQVFIKDGPFGGFMGLFVEEIKPRERVMVMLNTIGYQARVEVERSLVSRVVEACRVPG